MRTMYILRTDDRPTDLAFWKISNGHVSATGRPIHFMFGSTVGISGTADRMDLFPVAKNPRGGRSPSWKISSDHISGMGYLIHFHKLESSLGGIPGIAENNERGVIRLVTIENISCEIFIFVLQTHFSLNRWPSVQFCVVLVHSVLYRLMVWGLFYKTFQSNFGKLRKIRLMIVLCKVCDLERIVGKTKGKNYNLCLTYEKLKRVQLR